MEVAFYAFINVLVAGLLFLFYLLIKVDVAFKNHMKILKAIEEFMYDDNYEEALRILGELEELEDTLWRLWDWGCKNILPKDDYELIKPYIH